ncbi:hypothetical protein K490DRAFT_60922 [Saccharata proteae CBS 121410]|uniref:Uncharacterized protein n=1 Tax=Saccharata proteae CBS 121410 TaxID=1314787 RepID=A0A9P4M1S5_9PEZI|nr:hypothetical protein K490DRAFT_60922 [Saccharata proteae CBS 121410]
MKSFNVLTLLFHVFLFTSSVFATTKTDNFETVEAAYGGDLTSLGSGTKIAFFEKWHGGNANLECVAGFNHIRLIIGELHMSRATRGKAAEWDIIRAQGYDLGKDGTSLWGNDVDMVSKEWNLKKAKARGNTFVWKGRVKSDISKTTVDKYMKQWAQDHPTYNIVTNSCLTFANALWDYVKE